MSPRAVLSVTHHRRALRKFEGLLHRENLAHHAVLDSSECVRLGCSERAAIFSASGYVFPPRHIMDSSDKVCFNRGTGIS